MQRITWLVVCVGVCACVFVYNNCHVLAFPTQCIENTQDKTRKVLIVKQGALCLHWFLRTM